MITYLPSCFVLLGFARGLSVCNCGGILALSGAFVIAYLFNGFLEREREKFCRRNAVGFIREVSHGLEVGRKLARRLREHVLRCHRRVALSHGGWRRVRRQGKAGYGGTWRKVKRQGVT